MELLILDNEFGEIATVEIFSSLQWNRKYYDYGNFELEPIAVGTTFPNVSITKALPASATS